MNASWVMGVRRSRERPWVSPFSSEPSVEGVWVYGTTTTQIAEKPDISGPDKSSSQTRSCSLRIIAEKIALTASQGNRNAWGH